MNPLGKEPLSLKVDILSLFFFSVFHFNAGFREQNCSHLGHPFFEVQVAGHSGWLISVTEAPSAAWQSREPGSPESVWPGKCFRLQPRNHQVG